jgi:hypothetical protein
MALLRESSRQAAGKMGYGTREVGDLVVAALS